MTGLGKMDGRTVVLVGHQKGRDLKERTNRNFGMAYPEGYRKAMRAMELADRHGFPLVTMVDTPGAYPGVAAEQHGQGGAIARSQAAMVAVERADRRVRHRRGRVGGRGRDRRRRPRPHAGERDLLGHLAGGVRCDPLARRGEARKAAAAFKPDARHCLELGVVDAIVPSRRAARTAIPTAPRSS